MDSKVSFEEVKRPWLFQMEFGIINSFLFCIQIVALFAAFCAVVSLASARPNEYGYERGYQRRPSYQPSYDVSDPIL